MHKPIKILILNDQPAILKSLQNALHKEGYQTIPARNGAEALSKMKKHKPDLVCLEIDLPDISVLELLKKIKGDPEFQETPVIFLSAKHPNSTQQANGLEAGANGYLTYPISDRELLARIQNLLRVTTTEKTLKSLQKEMESLIEQSQRSRQTLLSLLEDQKHIEQTLRESEEKYRNVVERANDGIVIVQDNKIKFANFQLAKLLGYSLEEIIGTPYSTYIHPEELPLVKNRYERRMAGETVSPVYETRLLRKDGTPVDVELNAGIIPYEGKPADLVFVRDITERKKAEKALQESEARFRRLAENAQDLIYRYEFFPKRGFTYVSPIATAMTGYTPEEHYADPDLGLKIVHPEDRPLLEQYFQNWGVFQKPIILRWIRKDGQILWTEQRNVPIYDDQGNLVAIEGIARDITERKKAEEILQREAELEAFLADVSMRFIHLLPEELEATIVGVLGEIALLLHADRSYIFLFEPPQSRFSPVYEWTAPGIEPIAEKAKHFPYNLFPEVIEQFKKSKPIFIDEVSELPQEADLAKKILKTYHVQSLLLVPIVWRETLKGFVGLDRVKAQKKWSQQDVDALTTLANMFALLFERTSAEQQIQKALQEKETLLRELYHRTKNNMMVMSSLMALKLENCFQEETRHILRDLDGRIQTMALVHQKLYQSHDLSHVDLKDYVPELVELLIKNYQVGALDLSLKMEIDPIRVLFDIAIPLGLVLNELISNSLKHAFRNREKGTISIRLKETPTGEIELVFADDGIGLPEKFQKMPPSTLGFQTIFMIIENQLQGKVQWITDHGLKWIISFGKSGYKERV